MIFHGLLGLCSPAHWHNAWLVGLECFASQSLFLSDEENENEEEDDEKPDLKTDEENCGSEDVVRDDSVCPEGT